MSFSGSGSAASSGNLRFASAEEIEARLRRHFPTIDSEVLKDFSFAISRGRYLYNDAKKMLKELVVISSVQSAVVDAIEEEKKVQQQQRREEEQQRKQQQAEVQRRQLQQEPRVGSSSQQPPPAQPNNNTYDPRQHQPHRATTTSASSLSSSSSAAVAPAVVSAASNAMELDPSLAYVQPHEAVLYHTTMTASRQVRYHCRLMLNLLYMRRVQFKEFDVADNVFIQRQLQRLTGLGGQKGGAGGGGSRGGRGDEQLQLPLPLLFVGESFVGTYETCQELEDNDRLLDKMVSLGFHYVPAPLTSQQQQQNSSHRFNDDEDEDEDYFDEQKRGGYRSGGPQQAAGVESGQRWFD